MCVATIVCSYISKYMIAIWIVVLIVMIKFCRCKGQMKQEKCAYFCEQKVLCVHGKYLNSYLFDIEYSKDRLPSQFDFRNKLDYLAY